MKLVLLFLSVKSNNVEQRMKERKKKKKVLGIKRRSRNIHKNEIFNLCVWVYFGN